MKISAQITLLSLMLVPCFGMLQVEQNVKKNQTQPKQMMSQFLQALVTSERIATGVLSSPKSLAYSSDEEHVIGCDYSYVLLWDRRAGTVKKLKHGLDIWVNDVRFSPDGKKFASGLINGTVEIWDVKTKKRLFELKGHNDSINAIAWSPDGVKVASGASDGTIIVWDAVTGKMFKKYNERAFVKSLSWSPDGTRIVIASIQNVKIINVVSGEHYRHLVRSIVNSVSWLPDNTHIVVGDDDGRITVWNVVTKKYVWSVKGHTYWINEISCSPDGRYIASASYDKTIKLWNASTGELVRTITDHKERVNSVNWSPNSTHLISGSADWSIRVHRITFEPEMFELNQAQIELITRIINLTDVLTLNEAESDMFESLPKQWKNILPKHFKLEFEANCSAICGSSSEL